jgi:hypothetical protein
MNSRLLLPVAATLMMLAACAKPDSPRAAVAAPGGGELLIGAGDIASCRSNGDEATAELLDLMTGTVFTLGDNVYDRGTSEQFAKCYAPSWGRHLGRTRPVPGNHDYGDGGMTPNADGYFDYFGVAAGEKGKGYYSYDIGAWHVVVLNSALSCHVVSCAAGSPQERWLRADLAASAKRCTIAMFHHPRWNSGEEHGDNLDVAPFWNALYEAGVEVVLNGHEHVYERFAPQTPAGRRDDTRGIRQFTVGTGGNGLYPFGPPHANSEARNNRTYGLLELTLREGSYGWRFVPVTGGNFFDSGNGPCH